MRLAVVAIALSIVLSGMAVPPQMEGRVAFHLGRYDHALATLKERADHDPEAALWLGRTYDRLARPAEAIKAWQTAAKGGSKQAEKDLEAAQRALDEAESALGPYRDAITYGTQANWAELRSQLERFVQAHSDSTWGRLASVSIADCLAREGKATEAAAAFRSALQQAPSLADYVLWRLGRLGDSEAFARLLTEHPHSPLAADSALTLGKELLDTDPAKAATYLEKATRKEEAYLLLGTKGPENERLAWLRLHRKNFPEGALKLKVAQAMAEYDTLPASERYQVGVTLYEGYDYSRATKLLKDFDSGWALYRRARCEWRLGHHGDAIILLDRALKRDPSLRGRVLLTRGQIEDRRKRYAAAAPFYHKAAAMSGEVGLDGLELLSKLLRKQDKNASLIDRQIIRRYPNSEAAIEARWRFMWNAYEAGKFAEAKHWASSLGHRPIGRVLGAGGAFWLGKLLEREGKKAEAIATYREVQRRKPHSYYGWRAKHRADALSGAAPDPGFHVADSAVRPPAEQLEGLVTGRPPADATWKGLARAPETLRVLGFLGQFEGALALAQDAKLDDSARSWLAMRAGKYTEAIKLADTGRLLFPLGYWPLVESATRPRGIDPLLFTSLVKQESLFDEKARSWVGAMGLAQLMPFTAKWVATQVEGPARDLTDPEWNLKLGAWYLGHTRSLFQGEYVYAVAAYNAGPGAVKKWLGKHSDMDAFVESIPYSETRHYVKKVFGNLWSYQAIYQAE